MASEENATRIEAEKTEVCVRFEDYTTGKRPKTFALIIEHKGGTISVPVKMEDLKRWEREVKQLGHAMWVRGQHLEHYTIGQ